MCTTIKFNSVTPLPYPVAYLGFYLVGVQIILGKVVVFAWRQARGVREHVLARKFNKMQFGAF